MQILFIGDVVGKSGCRYLERTLPELRRQYGADVTIVNGENSAPGNGITAASAQQIFQCGADLITTGNHAFQRRDSLAIFERRDVLRPANSVSGCSVRILSSNAALSWKEKPRRRISPSCFFRMQKPKASSRCTVA